MRNSLSPRPYQGSPGGPNYEERKGDDHQNMIGGEFGRGNRF
jgi:hypothetical protein